ncbi:hypothetical protein ZWY2020_016872 [Hordeum vulgare]|nr:hypothetical protein ZWY2020_016872 [Hordeum vulgare]
MATTMAHAVLVLLAWHPDLIMPTPRPRRVAADLARSAGRHGPHCKACKAHGGGADVEELDEEFDTIPSAKSPEVKAPANDCRLGWLEHGTGHGR